MHNLLHMQNGPADQIARGVACHTSLDDYRKESLAMLQWRTEGLRRRPPPPQPHRPTRLAPSGLGVSPPPPPPPRLVNPASATALCNEVTLLICLGLIFFLQLGPTSWSGAPSKACARGPCPLPPPLGTPLLCSCLGCIHTYMIVVFLCFCFHTLPL